MPSSNGRPQRLRVAERRRHAGIGHRHDDVGLRRRFARQSRAHRLARVVDRAAVDDGIRARRNRRIRRCRAARAAAGTACRLVTPSLVDHDDLAVLDVAHEVGADDVERAGLRGEDRTAVEFAEHQRPDAERIARADQLLVGERDQRVGALDLPQRFDEAVDDRWPCASAAVSMQDDFGVRGRLADRAVARSARAAASGRW